MTELYSANTRLEVWARATKSLINEEYRQDVILHIDSPGRENDLSSEVFDELNKLYEKEDMEPIHTVAEWIFPGWLYLREGIDGVFEKYPDQLDMILDNRRGYQWGTYFGRMINKEDPDTGETYNPLKNLIEKMEQANQSNNPTYHSCYEIDLHHPSFDIPLYEGESDRKQRRNLPCLSHLSFKLFNNEVHLTALYRSHDYRFKVPGNLLGLARLQEAVAEEVAADTGQLVVHSSRASINKNKPNIDKFRELVNDTFRRLNNQSVYDYIS